MKVGQLAGQCKVVVLSFLAPASGFTSSSLRGAPASIVGEDERQWGVSAPPNRIISGGQPFLCWHQEPAVHIPVQVRRSQV